MKKFIIILATAFLLISNLVIPTTVLAAEEATQLVSEFFNSTLK